MSTKRTLQDHLQLKEELAARLKEHGVELDKITDVLDQLELYVDGATNIEQLRNEQFHESAYALGVEISAASNKNVDKISAHLRRFAYHVVSSVSEKYELHLSVEDVVDGIPDMEDERYV